MKKFITLTLMLLIYFPTSTLAETWKITSLEWPPYSGQSLEGGGTAVMALRTLLRKKDIDLVVEFYPWKRAKSYARDSDYVGYFPAWPQGIDEGFVASPTIQKSEVGILYLEGNAPVWGDVHSLFEKYKVGLINTYSYPENIQNAYNSYKQNTDFSPDEESLIKMLTVGRMDVAITDPKVMLYHANLMGISNIKVSEKIFEKIPLLLSFRNEDDNQTKIELLKSLIESEE